MTGVVAADSQQMLSYLNQSQEKYVPLSMILDNAIQRTYHQLMLMIDMFPSTPDKERKIKLIAYSCKTRLLFMRIYALVKFMRQAHINVSNILSFLDQQSFIFVDTADYLYHLAKVKLVNARLPSYSILTAVDVLTLGTYPRLPSCIKDRILPPEKISDEEKQKTLKDLNRIIQCRLALSELPIQLKNFRIENGCVKFQVRNEFEIKLTLISDDFKLPWRVLKINFLVRDAQDPNRPIVHNVHTNYVHDIIQMRLNENNRPLVDIYKALHFFSQSLQLEILFDQMNSLNRMTLGRFYKITEYSNWKKLTIKYWLDYSSKSQYDFKFTIFTNENSDYLQTNHYPPLNWRDHRNIDSIFRTDELLIEKIIYQIIKYRSKKRLMDIQSVFENLSYCKITLIEEKPALQIQFLISKLINQSIWIMIDYYTGLFQVLVPNSLINSTLKNSIEACINSDFKNIDQLLLNLRLSLLLRRCESLVQINGFKCYEDLSIVAYSNNDQQNFFSKLEKNRLFIELKKQERIYILVTIKASEDVAESNDSSTNSLTSGIYFSYYILNLAKCKYDGELDPTKPFLKLMSLSQFKRNSLFYLNQRTIPKEMIRIKDNNTSELVELDPCILEFVKTINLIEERLPYAHLVSILNKQNVVTQNVQTEVSDMLPVLNLSLISSPLSSNPLSVQELNILDYQSLDPLGRKLWSMMTSFTIRQKYFKDYLNVTPPVSYNKSLPAPFGFLSKFLFIVEFTFKQKALYDGLEESSHAVSNNRINVHNIPIEANNLEALYKAIELEWISMCKMFHMILEIKAAWLKYPELAQRCAIKELNLKRIVFKYGPSLAYTVQFKWSKETKNYEITLGVDHSSDQRTNHHVLLVNEIKKYFASINYSASSLLQILNCTSVIARAFARLNTLPKFYSRLSNNPLQAMPGLTLMPCSLTHFKIWYYSTYCLDVHVKANGLVSIRDGSFGLCDISMALDGLHPIQFLNTFLNLFLDENVQEILRRRCSLVEDDNPASPTQPAAGNVPVQSSQSQLNAGSQSTQNPSHVFLPPTSPAVQAASRGSNATAAAPSPMGNFFSAQSPRVDGMHPTTPAPLSNAPPSISAQSPSGAGNGATTSGAIANYGSPATAHLSHSSPGGAALSSQQGGPASYPSQLSQPPSAGLGNQQQPLSVSAQSPSAAFMSPANPTSQQNYSIQSPANFTDISLQSPLQPSMPIRSPFVGPSPSSTTPNPAQSNYNQSMAASNREEDRQQTQQSQSKSSSSQQTGQNQHSQSSSGTASSSLNTTSALLLNQHQYKKFHSASIPIYLSENGFLKMLSKDATSNYCPLEVFLASSHMRKKLIKYVRSDSATFMIKNQDQNIYRTYLFEFQILNDISPSTYHAFALQLTQTSPVDLPTDLIQRYFSTRVICPPYKSSQAISFFNMLSTNEPKVFKDFMQLLDFELNSAAYKSYAWRFKFCWCLPNGYVPRSNKPGPVLSFYQNASQIGFSRRDKYYFLIYLHYQQPVQQQRTFSPPVILLFCVYDSAMNNCYFEIFKPLSEANNNLYNIYENYISSIVTASKQKEYSLAQTITEMMANLPYPLAGPPQVVGGMPVPGGVGPQPGGPPPVMMGGHMSR